MRRILVVEDTPTNMLLTVTILERAGFHCLRATDGQSGIEVARSEHPDLILMDVGLPGIDGLTATRELKADPQTRNIPIIALTSSAMKGDRQKALEAGCDGYLTKPIDRKELIAEIYTKLGLQAPS